MTGAPHLWAYGVPIGQVPHGYTCSQVRPGSPCMPTAKFLAGEVSAGVSGEAAASAWSCTCSSPPPPAQVWWLLPRPSPVQLGRCFWVSHSGCSQLFPLGIPLAGRPGTLTAPLAQGHLSPQGTPPSWLPPRH